MTTQKIQFLFSDKIIELKNSDPNETLLNFIRTKLKKQVQKKDVQKVAVEPVQWLSEN